MQFIILRKINLKIVSCVVLYEVTLGVIDTISITVVGIFIDSNIYALIGEMNDLRILCIILSKSILTLLVLLIYKYQRNMIIANRYLIILTVLMLSITMILYISFGVFANIANERIVTVSVITFCSMIALLVMSVLIVYKMADAYENKQELALATLKNETLETTLKDTKQNFTQWKKEVHDYRNKLICYYQLLEKNELDTLKNLLQSETDLMAETISIYNSGNSAVDAILNAKKRYANQLEIPMHIQAKLPENPGIQAIHLCSILGNLLDNAIEASIQETTPNIQVSIAVLEQQLMIIIKNRSSKPISPDYATHKPQKTLHGIGVSSVQSTIGAYDGVFTLQQEDDYICATCILPIS
jgi:sensor histidine kinase YesM